MSGLGDEQKEIRSEVDWAPGRCWLGMQGRAPSEAGEFGWDIPINKMWKQSLAFEEKSKGYLHGTQYN